MGLESQNSNVKRHEFDPTAEDTETFIRNTRNRRDKANNHNEQNGDEEEKEFSKDSFSNIHELRKDIETPAYPVFQAVDRSDLPATAKMNSILSQELKNITLDENHFMLPAPEANNPHGIKIKVYLFGTKECIPIHISSKSKVVDVIRHLITVAKSEPKEPAAYELRLIDDDEDFYVPFYEISALEPNDSVGEFTSLALCRNKKYQPPKAATTADLAALGKDGSKDENVFTIHIKLPFLQSITEIPTDSKMSTLSDLLKKINKKFEVDLRENFITFKIYSEIESQVTSDNIETLVYNHNELDYKLMLKNLPSKELELSSRVFGDSVVGGADFSHEEKMSCSIKITGLANFENFEPQPSLKMSANESSTSSADSPEKPKVLPSKSTDKARDVKDFLFNDLTAKQLQQFDVIKINYRGKRQRRVLGIDGYAIYNDKDPNRQK